MTPLAGGASHFLRRGASPAIEWLAPFPQEVADRVQKWAGADTIVLAPDPSHRQFRLDPYEHLPRLAAALDDMRRTIAEPGKVLWFFDSFEGQGLDVPEVRAVLDPWLAIEIAETSPPDNGVVRTVAAGRFRHDHLGFAVTFDARGFGSVRDSIRQLSALADAGCAPVVVFFTAAVARLIGRVRYPPLLSLIDRLAALGAAPGIIVSGKPQGFAALTGRVAALRRLWNRSDADVVVRARRLRVDHFDVTAATRGIHDAGVTFDSSVAPHSAGPFAAWIRAGTYFPSGAFFPQTFDFRTPAAHPAAQPEFIELAVNDMSDGLRAMWNAAVGTDQVRLARLLDYFRIESYMRRPDDVGLAQRYHDFRVYNWATEASPVRTVLAECGSLPLSLDVAAVIRDVRHLQQERGARFHTDPASFFRAARGEAQARLGATEPLRLQADEHHYLERIPRDAPLRADVQFLLEPLPPAIGSTLELGAGFGRLAEELSHRSTRYVCLDLGTAMMRHLRPSQKQFGLVGDIHSLPFADATFETVIANNVLEHAYDPIRALSEIARVLTDTGVLHALIPLDALNARHRLPAHLWKADLANIRTAFAASGLDIEPQIVSLYSLAIAGSFPSCDGFVCRVHARRNRMRH